MVRPRVTALWILAVLVGLFAALVPETPYAAAVRSGGTLRLSAEVALPGATIRVRGRIDPAMRRRVVLQRSVDDRAWRNVGAARSSRRGRFTFTTTLPGRPSLVVRYRAHLPKRRVAGTVRPARFTSTEAVRTSSATEPGPPTSPPPPSPTGPPPPGSTPPPLPGGRQLVAEWQMNEAPGSTRMLDTSGRSHHGAVSPDAAAQGLTLDGSAYNWSTRCRDCPPVAPGRLVVVNDHPDLEIVDPAVRWSLEFRFRTTAGYGNIMQKGQATAAGGQIKVEDAGSLRCVFKGANGSTAVVEADRPLNDGLWHTVACVHAGTWVAQWVDGVQVATAHVGTGRIDNADPFVMGGKRHCDQRSVGCDYFSGTIEWARVFRG